MTRGKAWPILHLHPSPKRARLLPRGGAPSPHSPWGLIPHHYFHPFPNIVSMSWACEGSRELSSRCFGRGAVGEERGQAFPAPCSCLWLCLLRYLFSSHSLLLSIHLSFCIQPPDSTNPLPRLRRGRGVGALSYLLHFLHLAASLPSLQSIHTYLFSGQVWSLTPGSGDLNHE